MSQHDFDIANQSASSARADINNALKALASLSSGSTAPATTYANMLWYETDTNTLKMRAEADDAWISIGYLNQSTDTFALFDNTKVVNSGGTQTGLLGDQSTAVWEAGTGTTESLVSPAKVKAAVEALAPTPLTTVFSSTGGSITNISVPSGVSISRVSVGVYDVTIPNQGNVNYIVNAMTTQTNDIGENVYYGARVFDLDLKTSTGFRLVSYYVSATAFGNYRQNVDGDQISFQIYGV